MGRGGEGWEGGRERGLRREVKGFSSQRLSLLTSPCSLRDGGASRRKENAAGRGRKQGGRRGGAYLGEAEGRIVREAVDVFLIVVSKCLTP